MILCLCDLYTVMMCCFFFFFKQKTAYEMRISDWSSDVCSSDLIADMSIATAEQPPQRVGLEEGPVAQARLHVRMAVAQVHQRQWPEDHERGGAGDGGGDEQQGEEHDDVGTHRKSVG